MDDFQSPVPLQEVWTKRQLRSEEGDSIDITIGAPVYVGNGWHWVCPFRIEGLPHDVNGCTFGADETQALERIAPTIRQKLLRAGVDLKWQQVDLREIELPQLLSPAPSTPTALLDDHSGIPAPCLSATKLDDTEV